MTHETARQILEIKGGTAHAELNHLHDLAIQVRDGCIVEVGIFRGRATCALAAGSRDGFGVPVYAVDPQEPFVGVYGGRFGPEDRASFFRTVVKLSLHPIVRVVNLSSEWLAESWPMPVRLLWIDGDHRLEGVQRDVRCWLPKLHDDASIVFDDALDKAVGPYHVIEQLLSTLRWEKTAVVGKTVTIVRGKGCGG